MTARHRIATSLALAAALIAAMPAAHAAPTHAAAKPAPAADAKPVDVNHADAAALESVPGIGKSLAARIIDFREKNGAYQSVDDLLKVQGIGEKSLEKLKPYLTVSKAK